MPAWPKPSVFAVGHQVPSVPSGVSERAVFPVSRQGGLAKLWGRLTFCPIPGFPKIRVHAPGAPIVASPARGVPSRMSPPRPYSARIVL